MSGTGYILEVEPADELGIQKKRRKELRINLKIFGSELLSG